jgi:hypothetical protein
MWLSDRAYAQGVMLWHAPCVMLAGPLLMMNTARVSCHYTHDTLPDLPPLLMVCALKRSTCRSTSTYTCSRGQGVCLSNLVC